jgi:F0F1-type ATP synthase epsilon subunit
MSDVDDQKVIGSSDGAKGEKEEEQDQAVVDYSKTKGKGELSIAVKVYSPYHDYYDGQAFSVSAENATGPFDVLPKMHNFISLLIPCDLVIRTVNKGEQKIRISGGLMHVKTDELIVFLDV